MKCGGVVAPASPVVRMHRHYPTTFSGPPLRQRRGLLVCGGNEEIPACAGMTIKKTGTIRLHAHRHYPTAFRGPPLRQRRGIPQKSAEKLTH